MKKPKITWILIANGGRAHILSSTGSGTGIEEVDGMSFENPNPPARDIMADKQGRAFDRFGGGRHAMEYPSDPAEQSAQEFARYLDGILQKAVSKNSFDRLAIVATPSMLANLRQSLSPDVRARISAEVDKDYTKIPIAKLPQLLRQSGALD